MTPLLNFPRRLNHLVLLSLTAIALTGCIPLEDIDTAWNSATIDPALEGSWKAPDSDFPIKDSFVTFRKKGSAYEVESAQASMPAFQLPEGTSISLPLARTLEFDGDKYLIVDARPMFKGLKEATSSVGRDSTTTSPQGGIMRYLITGNDLSVFTLKPERLVSAISAGEITGSAPDTNTQNLTLPTVSNLGEFNLNALQTLKTDETAWIKTNYKRVQDVEVELEKSRTYRGGPETLANTVVSIASPEFERLCHSDRDVLMRYLQASPEWNVYQEGQEDIVAYQRQQVDGDFSDTSNGYFNRGRAQTRAMFRFSNSRTGKSKVPAEIPGFALNFTEAKPTAGDVALKLLSEEQGVESYLAVGDAGVWFEFFEQSPVEERIHTRDAVHWLSNFASELFAASNEIRASGHAQALMPANSIKAGEPDINLVDHTFTAWINPGRQGFVYLKIYDVETSAIIENRHYDWGSKEYVGWSSDPQTLFRYQKKLYHLSRVPGLSSTIRIEVCFRPTDGTASPSYHGDPQPGDKVLIELVTMSPES